MAFGVGYGGDGSSQGKARGGKRTTGTAKSAGGGAAVELAFAVVVETGGPASRAGDLKTGSLSVCTVPGVVSGVEKGCSA